MSRPALRVTDDDELPAPRIDTDSQTVLNEAIDALAQLRTPYWLGDAGVRLHALASLITQADQALHDAVRDARDQEFTWPEIAQLHRGLRVKDLPHRRPCGPQFRATSRWSSSREADGVRRPCP
jgi:hypothetical protein